ncbi:SAVED domain-containing protein [Sorangium sp. So ce426]|uniref:SAVED domain-containing protein n=1 Tax=Sorangium sp. So ce426 TaxID=3133312 RepID=UPI003F5C88CB
MTGSARGAAIQGDDYQHLYAWHHALRMLAPDEGVTAISVEKRGIDLLDDVVVHRPGRGDEHYQVKYSVSASNPIDNAWFIEVGTGKEQGRKKSILQRFWDSYSKLRAAGGRPHMALFTNRPLDVNDPLLKLRDGSRGLLGPRLREEGPLSRPGQRLKEWAMHLGIAEDELLEMLDHLELLTDQGPASLLARAVTDRMAARGLREDADAVEQGALAIREWVKEGTFRIDRAMLAAEIDRRALRGGPPRATLVVQQVERDPFAREAHAWVDWVALFEGDEPQVKRRLSDPSLWNTQLRADLQQACDRIRALGFNRILVRGRPRLTPAFMVGFELSDTRNAHVACLQRDEMWSTEASPVQVDLDVPPPEELDLGSELVVALSVTHDIADDVRDYVRQAGLPVGRLLNIRTSRIGRGAMPDGAYALGWATAVRSQVMREARRTGATKVHLFMAGPAGAALFLGHSWNCVPTTQLYEELNPGYTPSFCLA